MNFNLKGGAITKYSMTTIYGVAISSHLLSAYASLKPFFIVPSSFMSQGKTEAFH